MQLGSVANALWYGQAPAARLARMLLAPVSWAFGWIVARRNAASDAVALAAPVVPVISVGNLTVGGTGKTPISAWIAEKLRAGGGSPALVLRGYGDDEVLVHERVNPGIPVLVGADRNVQVQRAADAGADVVVLDDAFQHRRAARTADVVLVSADRWTGDVRLLPAGPFREPLRSLRRAALVIVTVKSAPADRVAATTAAIRLQTDSTVVTVDLVPASCVAIADGATIDPAAWHGRRILAVCGIGDPVAFNEQLVALGLNATTLVFADHQAYDERLVARIAARAAGFDVVLCTLKDAVKLGPKWSGSAVPLWYLSQSVVPRDGAGALDALVQSVLDARRNDRSFSDPSR